MDLRLISTPLSRAQKVAVCPLADVKAQARVLASDEDALIERSIETAYDFLSGPNGWLGRCCLLEEDWEFYASGPVLRRFELPMRPLSGGVITSFDYLQADGTYLPVASTVYALAPSETFAALRLLPSQYWPYTGLRDDRAYRIRFRAGYAPVGSPTAVPSPIVQSMKMLAAHWYRQRETAGEATPEIAYGLRALAGRYRLSPDHS